MANICDTKLSIQATEKSKNFEEKYDEMVKWLRENYMYEDYQSIDGDADFIEVYCGTKWNVQVETLQEFAKLFGVRVRAMGEESGVGFVQVAHIEDDGSIISNEEIGYQF